jgi:hypothetical protein
MASLGQQFTWICQVTDPPAGQPQVITFYRNGTSVGNIGYTNDCVGGNVDPKYTYSCTTQKIFNLIIPAQSLTQEEQYTLWRCAHFSASPSYSSTQKQLVIASKN